MKKNIIIIIFLGSILLIGMGFGIFSIISKKNIENNIKEVKTLLDKRDYEKASILIKDKKILNDDVHELLLEEMLKYKISTLSDLLNIKDDEWLNIEKYNKLLITLDLSNDIRYKYTQELEEIKNEEKQYFPAIRWYIEESESYRIITNLASSEELSFRTAASALQNYSFEKYGVDNIYIKDLNENKENLASAYIGIANAVKNRNLSQFEKAEKDALDASENERNISVKILQKQDEVTKKVKNLPAVGQ